MKYKESTIFDCGEEKSKINELISVVNKSIRRHHSPYCDELHKLHEQKIDNINSVRLDCFKSINDIPDLDKLIETLIGDKVTKILGPDLLIQNKLNISIQLPGDKSAILKPHSDCWSGDSPFQINLWIPLTDAYETNSMFIFDYRESADILKKIHSEQEVYIEELIQPRHFQKINVGQILLFNPALIHGNVLNQTKQTRVSLNIRFKSLFTPDGLNTSRGFGTYYRLFKLSEWTRLAFDLREANANGE